MSQQFELYLTCPKSLEGLLLEEARGLGLEEAREQVAAVRGHVVWSSRGPRLPAAPTRRVLWLPGELRLRQSWR